MTTTETRSMLAAPTRSRGRNRMPVGYEHYRPDRPPKRSIAMVVVMSFFAAYALLPLVWLFINSTKTPDALFNSFGLWFSGDFALFANIQQVLTREDGIYVQWFLNSLIYVVVGAGGATLIATLAGYGMAKFAFPGKKLIFAVVLGTIAIPGTALAVPTFLMFSSLSLTDTMLSVIIPSLASPFGFYLMWIFARESVPTEILEAARMDGASEVRTFLTIALRMMAPGIVTVLLFQIVGIWNNYFLPLIMLRSEEIYPLPLGLHVWNLDAAGPQPEPIYNLIITASLLSVVPIIAAFLALQRFWQNGLTVGGVKA